MFVSLVGKDWKKVAESSDLEAWLPAYALERVRKEVITPTEAKQIGPDPIAGAYSLALQRPPTATERAAAEKLLAQHGRAAFCRALLNRNALNCQK